MTIISQKKGAITTYVIIFGTIFLLLTGGLLGFVLLQLKQSSHDLAWNRALEIAEAGADYYRWCLNNDAEEECQLQKDYKDTNGNTVGTFSLEIDSVENCGIRGKTTITSRGWDKNFPDIERTVQVMYAKSSVAEYSYLLNDNVWAGADREIRGLYHSNGGVRMDGENQSLTTSAQEEWICTSSFGCDSCPTDSTPACRIEGSNCICPGVFTTTENSQPDLFNSPVPVFDFDGITVDLAEIKNLTISSPREYYWPPSTDIDANADGYHLKFRNDGTFEVWIITGLNATYAYSLEEGWHYDYFVINNEYQYGSAISVSSTCSVIFIEDNLWIDGEIQGKITVASANLISPTEDTNIILSGNINYTTLDGSDGLALIGENNVLIPPNSPDQMELRGIFVAQKGHFGRNHYPDNIKEKLEIYGAIVSNGRVGTRWSSGGQIVSGYLKRENYSDQNLIYDPPLFVPYTRTDFESVSWEELE
jgi:hypothetical protein